LDKLKNIPVKNILFVLLLGEIVFLSLNFSYAVSPIVSGSNFNILVTENGGIGFQNDDKYILLTPITGDLNSSTNSLSIYEGGGTFRFLSNETFTFKITFDVTNVKVEGDKGNVGRFVDSGDSISIDSTDIVVITWNIHVEAWLPLMFILGMFGIVSMIGGAMYGVKELKKHNYEHGLVTSIIFIAVGFSFILAWLWG